MQNQHNGRGLLRVKLGRNVDQVTAFPAIDGEGAGVVAGAEGVSGKKPGQQNSGGSHGLFPGRNIFLFLQ